ncbi:MAG: prolipoprotein diacylglyceryl transferase [Deltaproteobacteria bacterium]|nr:prolipoprotein diacylglyceryl transferase [Deltaproteobacteria bacterium]
MFPILLNIGTFPVHSYGFLIAVGFLLCVWVSKREGQRQGLSGEKIVDLGFWSLLVGMIGSRILYVITLYPHYLAHPYEIFYVWEGGLVFFGGPLLCIPFFFWYTKHYQLPRWKIIDIGATAIPLAHAFGRLGCLSAGCCHGKATGGNWGIKLYTELVEPGLRGVYVHPTQIYESVCLMVLFFGLRSMRYRKKFDGEIVCTYLITYSIIRSIIEVFRGDTVRGFVIQDILSTSQFISILVIAGTLALYFKLRKNAQLANGVAAYAQ